MTHIGIVKDVLISGFVAPDNYYPIVHIFLSEMALTANLSGGHPNTLAIMMLHAR